MLNQPTLQKLQTLRLHGMAEAFRVQSDPAQRDGLADLSFEERFALLVDQEWTWRQNRALARRLSQAKFRYRASVEDIDFRTARGLDRSLLRSWTQNSAWVAEHQNIFLLGPCGVGKSWLACALGEKACRDGFTAFFIRTPRLFRDLALARADGSLETRLARLARIDAEFDKIAGSWPDRRATECQPGNNGPSKTRLLLMLRPLLFELPCSASVLQSPQKPN